MNDILEKLRVVIESRKQATIDESYVATLMHKGINKILEKVGEESTEVILAAKDAAQNPNQNPAVIQETADLWFHIMVMLSHLNIHPNAVMDELSRRFGLSGHEEMASRHNNPI